MKLKIGNLLIPTWSFVVQWMYCVRKTALLSGIALTGTYGRHDGFWENFSKNDFIVRFRSYIL